MNAPGQTDTYAIPGGRSQTALILLLLPPYLTRFDSDPCYTMV